MATPTTVNLRCPFCNVLLPAPRTQGVNASRGIDGTINVSITVSYTTEGHVCPNFPADIST